MSALLVYAPESKPAHPTPLLSSVPKPCSVNESPNNTIAGRIRNDDDVGGLVAGGIFCVGVLVVVVVVEYENARCLLIVKRGNIDTTAAE